MLNLIQITILLQWTKAPGMIRVENIGDLIISNICINKESEKANTEGISISQWPSHSISKTYFLNREDERNGIIRDTQSYLARYLREKSLPKC